MEKYQQRRIAMENKTKKKGKKQGRKIAKKYIEDRKFDKYSVL